MSKTAITSQTVVVTGDGLVTTDGPDVQTNASAVVPGAQALVVGANTINVPTGAIGVKIKPPPANTQSLILKGVTGDTGVRISPTAPTTWLFDPAALPSTFVLTAGGSVNLGLVWC